MTPYTSFEVSDVGDPPVSVADVMEHAKLNSCEDAAWLKAQIRAATLHAERYTEQAFTNQLIKVGYDCWPRSIVVPRGKVLSVEAFQYYDANYVLTNEPTANFRIRHKILQDIVELLPNVVSPYFKNMGEDSFILSYRAGYYLESDVPEDVRLWIMMQAYACYEHRKTYDERTLYESPLAMSLLHPHRVYWGV